MQKYLGSLFKSTLMEFACYRNCLKSDPLNYKLWSYLKKQEFLLLISQYPKHLWRQPLKGPSIRGCSKSSKSFAPCPEVSRSGRFGTMIWSGWSNLIGLAIIATLWVTTIICNQAETLHVFKPWCACVTSKCWGLVIMTSPSVTWHHLEDAGFQSLYAEINCPIEWKPCMYSS